MTARHRTRVKRRGSPEKRVAKRTSARSLARDLARHRVLIACALALVHLVLAGLSFMPTPHTGGDNAAYLALARSLLENLAYLEIYDPAAPPHTQYPPVFPGILALALAAGLQPWAHFKILIALFSAGAVAFAFLWGVRRRRPLLALGVGLLLALSPGVLELAHWVLSDVPFWLFTTLALLAWERLPRHRPARAALAIAATVLVYFTRSAGLPLVLAALAWLALRRRWKTLAATAAVIVPLAGLWWLRARGHGGVDYVEQFWLVDPYDPSQGHIGLAGLLGRVWANLDKYARIHMPMLLADSTSAAHVVTGIVVAGFALYGWLCRVRRPGVAELFLPLYLGLLLVWPAVWSGERFLLPVYGMLLLYAGDGLVRAARALRLGSGMAPAAATASILLLIALPAVAVQIEIGSQCRAFRDAGDPYPCLSEGWHDFFDAAEWSGEHLPEGAVVIVRKPRLFWGLSGLSARIFPFSTEPEPFFEVVEDAGARYLLLDAVDGLSRVYVTPILAGRSAGFCLVHVQGQSGTALFGILPGVRDMADDPTAGVDVQFLVCPAEYFRDPADREVLLRRVGGAGSGA